jgi:hypothetical protein
METLRKHLRKRVDASPAKYATLSVEEIKIRTRSGAQHAHDLAWWCEVFRNPSDPVHAALIASNLALRPVYRSR